MLTGYLNTTSQAHCLLGFNPHNKLCYRKTSLAPCSWTKSQRPQEVPVPGSGRGSTAEVAHTELGSGGNRTEGSPVEWFQYWGPWFRTPPRRKQAVPRVGMEGRRGTQWPGSPPPPCPLLPVPSTAAFSANPPRARVTVATLATHIIFLHISVSFCARQSMWCIPHEPGDRFRAVNAPAHKGTQRALSQDAAGAAQLGPTR